MLGENAIVLALQDAIAYFVLNLSLLVPEIYAYLSDEERLEIFNWWSNPQNQVAVQSGYPFQAVTAPQIAVTIETGEEISEFIGNSTGMVFSTGVGTAANGHGAYFRSVYYCHCFGFNQNFIYWLQALARWALLYQRDRLEQGVIKGNIVGYFQKQSLSYTGLVPVAESLSSGGGLSDSIFPFERIVILKATHIDTWLGHSLPSGEFGTLILNVPEGG